MPAAISAAVAFVFVGAPVIKTPSCVYAVTPLNIVAAVTVVACERAVPVFSVLFFA